MSVRWRKDGVAPASGCHKRRRRGRKPRRLKVGYEGRQWPCPGAAALGEIGGSWLLILLTVYRVTLAAHCESTVGKPNCVFRSSARLVTRRKLPLNTRLAGNSRPRAAP